MATNKLSTNDARLVAAAVESVIRAKLRGDARIRLDTPLGFSAGEKAFEAAVIKALEASGHLERVYKQ